MVYRFITSLLLIFTVLGVCCDVDIFKLTARAQSINREVYACPNGSFLNTLIRFAVISIKLKIIHKLTIRMVRGLQLQYTAIR